MPRARLIYREHPKKYEWKHSLFTKIVSSMTVRMLDTVNGKLHMCKLSMDDTPEPYESGKIFE